MDEAIVPSGPSEVYVTNSLGSNDDSVSTILEKIPGIVDKVESSVAWDENDSIANIYSGILGTAGERPRTLYDRTRSRLVSSLHPLKSVDIVHTWLRTRRAVCITLPEDDLASEISRALSVRYLPSRAHYVRDIPLPESETIDDIASIVARNPPSLAVMDPADAWHDSNAPVPSCEIQRIKFSWDRRTMETVRRGIIDRLIDGSERLALENLPSKDRFTVYFFVEVLCEFGPAFYRASYRCDTKTKTVSTVSTNEFVLFTTNRRFLDNFRHQLREDASVVMTIFSAVRNNRIANLSRDSFDYLYFFESSSLEYSCEMHHAYLLRHNGGPVRSVEELLQQAINDADTIPDPRVVSPEEAERVIAGDPNDLLRAAKTICYFSDLMEVIEEH